VSIDRLDAKILRVRRAFTRSRYAIAGAQDDLENHRLWLDQHRSAWAEDVKRCERKLNSELAIRALKQSALTLLLVGPIVCIALFRLIARFLPDVRGALLRGPRLLPLLNRHRTRIHFLPSLLLHSTKRARTSTRNYRIAGLDGPLCIGQPASSTVAAKSEISLLKARLIVASFGAVIVGFIVAATTPEGRSNSPADEPPRVHAPDSKTVRPPAEISKASEETEELEPRSVSGLVVQAKTPAEELLSFPAMTIAGMMSTAFPLTVDVEEPNAAPEPLEVTPPLRKPKIQIKAKSKRNPAKPRRQQTVWEQLPWLLAR
jgi:hypothetical protein